MTNCKTEVFSSLSLYILIRKVPRTSPRRIGRNRFAATFSATTSVYGHAMSLIMLKVYEVARFFASPNLGRTGEIFSSV